MSPPRSGRHGIVAFKKVRKCENKCENEKKISSFCSCFGFCKCTAAVALEGAVQRGTHVVVW